MSFVEVRSQLRPRQVFVDAVNKVAACVPSLRKPYQKQLIVNLNGIAHQRLELTSVGAKARMLVIAEQQLTQNNNPHSLFSMTPEMADRCEKTRAGLCKELRIPKDPSKRTEAIWKLRTRLEEAGLLFTKPSSPKGR